MQATKYLKKHQAEDGHWVPLWFGNQLTHDKKNPVYGTARVCTYLIDSLKYDSVKADLKMEMEKMISFAQQFILSQQSSDGSWGGEKGIPGTIEETSLAISALGSGYEDVCMKGFEWLKDQVQKNDLKQGPIGLYFAMLWYDEQMYPLVYYIEALRRFIYR